MNAQPPVAPTPAPVTAGALPWYRSPVYIGAVTTVLSTLLSLSPKAATAIGLNTPGSVSSAVEAVFQIVALGAGIFTALKRQTSASQPLTLTQKGADTNTATVAVVQTQTAMRAAGIPLASELKTQLDAKSPGV
jgi:hypothetical protein